MHIYIYSSYIYIHQVLGCSRSDERSALMQMLKQLEEGLQLHREQQVSLLCGAACCSNVQCVAL